MNRYYHVRFSCTFHSSGNATFEKAWVLGNLPGDGDGAAPVAGQQPSVTFDLT